MPDAVRLVADESANLYALSIPRTEPITVRAFNMLD
jgi:hypothetical protein